MFKNDDDDYVDYDQAEVDPGDIHILQRTAVQHTIHCSAPCNAFLGGILVQPKHPPSA